MAASASQTSDLPSERSFSLFLWVLSVAALLPAIAAASSLSWARQTNSLLLPGATMAGVMIAVGLGIGPWARAGRWLALSVAPLIAVGALYEIVAAAQPGVTGTASAMSWLLAVYLFALGTLVPLLVARLRQAWLALVAVWATAMGAWSRHLTAEQVWWVTWLLICSLALLGVAHLRDEASVWRRFNLHRQGPVLWPTARTVAVLAVVVALIGIIPLGASEIGLLHTLYDHSPFAHDKPLAYRTAGGTPVAVLGAPLTIDAPAIGGDTPIVSYTLQQGPTDIPPLLGATLDIFDGTTWRQSATTSAPPPTPGALPGGATIMKATVTVYNLPEVAANVPLLLGFDEPIAFSVPHVLALVTAGGSPDALAVADWSTGETLAAHTTYSVTSVAIPANVQAVGSLSPTLQQTLTQTPLTLTQDLQATAREWVGSATTPYQQASALITAMRANLTVDAQAKPPAGEDAVSWFLREKHGNVLLWTTTFILLARSIGLPMRLAEGYLPGSYSKQLNQMVVHASDATVWAQLAVPGAGWLDLFPGSNLTSITLPMNAGYNNAPTPTPSPPLAPTPATVDSGAQQSLPVSVAVGVGVLLFLAMILALGAFALAMLRLRRLGRRADPLIGFFARVALLARWAGVRLRASDTPAQATAKVVRKAPRQAAPLREVNGVYERLRYGRPEARGSTRVSLDGLIALWRALSRSLGRSAFRRFFRSHADATDEAPITPRRLTTPH